MSETGRLPSATGAVWRWSTDEHVGEMTVSTLARLADVIGCEPCELFEGGASDEG